MDENILPGIIPEQHAGTKTDIIASVTCESTEDAHQIYDEAKQRLLDVNNWHHLCGIVTATFKLTDETGRNVSGDAKTGYFFKIDIPGPGTLTGEGYDWVRIENIENDNMAFECDEVTAIQVRPAGNPKNDKQDVAHFFTDEATSSFLVQRTGTTVTAEVHGRNEKANTDAESAIDKTRNTMVATGAMVGFSAAQWKSLANGLLDRHK